MASSFFKPSTACLGLSGVQSKGHSSRQSAAVWFWHGLASNCCSRRLDFVPFPGASLDCGIWRVLAGSVRTIQYNTNSPPSSIEEKRYGDGETEEEAERCWDEIKRAMGSLILLTGSSVRLSSVALPILVRICDDFLQILVELNRSCAILTFQ